MIAREGKGLGGVVGGTNEVVGYLSYWRGVTSVRLPFWKIPSAWIGRMSGWVGSGPCCCHVLYMPQRSAG